MHASRTHHAFPNTQKNYDALTLPLRECCACQKRCECTIADVEQSQSCTASITKQALCAEAIGTLVLVMTVVGSGIMADQLSGGIDGLALIGNTLATGAMLVVLITVLGPVSGAHFNPSVTLTLMFS